MYRVSQSKFKKNSTCLRRPQSRLAHCIICHLIPSRHAHLISWTMQVSYKTENSTCISLQIPIEDIEEDLRDIKRFKKDDENRVIPRVKLHACLSNFFQQESLSDYFSAFLNRNTQVRKIYVYNIGIHPIHQQIATIKYSCSYD